MSKKFSKKDIVASSCVKVEDLIANLKAIENDDYNYSRDIQDLNDLLEHLNCRYKNYTESDDYI